MIAEWLSYFISYVRPDVLYAMQSLELAKRAEMWCLPCDRVDGDQARYSPLIRVFRLFYQRTMMPAL
jgi:hypothetical protein